jgi:hypothetical protein
MLIDLDEVATGVLVNAIALVGRRLSKTVEGWRGRGRMELYDIRWFETYRLTKRIPNLPQIESASAERLANILQRDEIHAALQELLAVRLTDAPDTDAKLARDVLCRTLAIADYDITAPIAGALADYYDNQIRAVVANLKADDSKLLAQIRLEAFAARLVSIVGAIERHAAALAARPGERDAAQFLVSYRTQVIDHHGNLEPPDFDQRRRVPIHEIYVPAIVTPELSSFSHSPPSRDVWQRSIPAPLDVLQLTGMLDRLVLLGDPGGGKTTAANVLMHYFASNEASLIPFLVTLRHYAAEDPPEYSIVGHIEDTLNVFYQSPPPRGMIDLLLLSGRAVVIFDGLDELLDTSRRADVTTRVERFCTEYPLAPVLVTSRVIGYEQARLDPRIFTTYMLRGFADTQVAEYTRKWFAYDSDSRPDDAEAFLIESAGISDLRSNPLMLALLCILYRGDGSLPRNRAEVYEQCASLMFRKWDARRKIHQELQAGHLIEPALRHLAWWLFTRSTVETAVTERDLVNETSSFLHGRGFESEDDARRAAREFVEFCRSRMWVFTDVGTTAAGEKLYAFTHRTFLEYFAAAQIAYNSDTAEQLAFHLSADARNRGLSVVGELAMQIKDHTSNNGGQRIYATMMAESTEQSTQVCCDILRFLVLCLRSVDPTPQRVRELTQMLVGQAISDAEPKGAWRDAMREMILGCGSYREIVADEVAAVVAKTIQGGDETSARRGLLLAASLPDGAAPAGQRIATRWESDADRILSSHAAALIAAAHRDRYLRRAALEQGFVSTKQALAMPGGLNGLFEKHFGLFPDSARWQPYIDSALHDLLTAWPLPSDSTSIEDLATIGDYLRDNQKLPWVCHPSVSLLMTVQEARISGTAAVSSSLSESAYLGAIAVMAIVAESREMGYRWVRFEFGPLSEFYPYLAQRHNPIPHRALPELLVPDGFKELFRSWANARLDLTQSD